MCFLLTKAARRLSNQNGDVTISKKFLKIEKTEIRLMNFSARRRQRQYCPAKRI
jgi:hypothetical protein